MSVCVFLRKIEQVLSYRRETALQSGLVLAKGGTLGLGDDILQT